MFFIADFLTGSTLGSDAGSFPVEGERATDAAEVADCLADDPRVVM